MTVATGVAIALAGISMVLVPRAFAQELPGEPLPGDEPAPIELPGDPAPLDEPGTEPELPELPGEPEQAGPPPPIDVTVMLRPDGRLFLTWSVVDGSEATSFVVRRDGVEVARAFSREYIDDANVPASSSYSVASVSPSGVEGDASERVMAASRALADDVALPEDPATLDPGAQSVSAPELPAEPESPDAQPAPGVPELPQDPELLDATDGVQAPTDLDDVDPPGAQDEADIPAEPVAPDPSSQRPTADDTPSGPAEEDLAGTSGDVLADDAPLGADNDAVAADAANPALAEQVGRAPSGLRIVGSNASTVVLGWDPARSATRYELSRDGQPIGSTRTLRYTDATVTEGEAYRYSISAVLDGGERVDAQVAQTIVVGRSPVVDDRSPLPPSTILAIREPDGSGRLSWSGAQDDRGVEGYDVYLDGSYVATVRGDRYAIPTLPPGPGSYAELAAFDTARNYSQRSHIAFFAPAAAFLTE